MEQDKGIEFTIDIRNLKVASRYNSKFKMYSKSNLTTLWLTSALLLVIAFDYRNHSLAYSLILVAFLLAIFYLTFSRLFYNPIIVAYNRRYIGAIIKLRISNNALHIDNGRFLVSFKLKDLSILSDENAYCVFFEKPIVIIPKSNINSDVLEYLQILQENCEKSNTSIDR